MYLLDIEAEAEQLPWESDTLPDHDYQLWLPQWQRLTQDTPTNIVLVPPQAQWRSQTWAY